MTSVRRRSDGVGLGAAAPTAKLPQTVAAAHPEFTDDAPVMEAWGVAHPAGTLGRVSGSSMYQAAPTAPRPRAAHHPGLAGAAACSAR